jgi:hypothetical protein
MDWTKFGLAVAVVGFLPAIGAVFWGWAGFWVAVGVELPLLALIILQDENGALAKWLKERN